MRRRPNRLGNAHTLKDIYKAYKAEQMPNTPYNIDYKTFRAISEEFNERIVEDILVRSKEFKLPYRLGSIRIKKTKMSFKYKNALKIDWPATKKAGMYIYHINDHTNGYKYRWYWDRGYSLVRNKTSYAFEATRTNKRTLASLLKSDSVHVDYFE